MAVHVTSSDPATGAAGRAAVTPIGGAGSVGSVTKLEEPATKAVPAAFAATTLNMYVCPFASPVTVHASGPDDHVHVLPPGHDVTV